MTLCYDAIGSAGGKYMALNPFPLRAHRRRSVQPDWVFMFTQFAEPIPWKRPYNCDARPFDKKFAMGWYKEVQKMLDAGQIIPSPHREKSGGLAAVADGMRSVLRGEVAGFKLVYHVTETQG